MLEGMVRKRDERLTRTSRRERSLMRGWKVKAE